VVDVGTGLAAGLGILASKDLLGRILGPSADYVGGEIANFVAKCNVNLDNVFTVATSKLGDRLDEPGQVNVRVLKEIINEGRFCEEVLTAEYFGGILASARSEHGDDRGVAFTSRVKEMSTFELKLHYVFYRSLLKRYRGKGKNEESGSEWPSMRMFLPINDFVTAMGIDAHNPFPLQSHAVVGLYNRGLIHRYRYGGSLGQEAPPGALGLVITPSKLGMELFTWASGVKDAGGRNFFSIDPLTELTNPPLIECEFTACEDVKIQHYSGTG